MSVMSTLGIKIRAWTSDYGWAFFFFSFVEACGKIIWGVSEHCVWVTWPLSHWPISPLLSGSSQITFLAFFLTLTMYVNCGIQCIIFVLFMCVF